MNVTAVLAEIVITGSIIILGIFLMILGTNKDIEFDMEVIKNMGGIILFFIIGITYFIGNLVNIFSHCLFDICDKRMRTKELKQNRKFYHIIRLKANKISGELKSFLDVRYSIIRLFRSSVLSLPVLGIGCFVWNPDFIDPCQRILMGIIPFLLAGLSFLAYINQTKKFYKTIGKLVEIVNTVNHEVSKEE